MSPSQTFGGAANPAAGKDRRQESFQRRVTAAELARTRDHPASFANGEETRYRCADGAPSYIASFTKGLPHDTATGVILRPSDFARFVKAIDSGVPSDLASVPLGPPRNGSGLRRWQSVLAEGGPDSPLPGQAPVRGWESASAGLAFDLEGPDAQSVAMPPAPTLPSDETVFEMAELYLMALARDIPFACWNKANDTIADAAFALNSTAWIKHPKNAPAIRRKAPFTPQTLFRGIGRGTDVGPYVSQFMLRGSATLGGKEVPGIVKYGGQELSLKVRRIKENRDWMTTFKAFVDVQNGANVSAAQEPDFLDSTQLGRTKFISTPRDLATYVHFDALYQAYLNACLILLADGVAFDPGLPFLESDEDDHQQGFATFGGPHILSLVCEVATRALKAVRFQKFNVHRRHRPEALGGLLHLQSLQKEKGGFDFGPEVESVRESLECLQLPRASSSLLEAVLRHNKIQNESEDRAGDGDREGSYLLPMAYPEGSPMHPAYGAGHATVAGACVTVLKAFFDAKAPYPVGPVKQASPCGDALIDVELGSARLTVEGELNKLASNISWGRSLAGVHWASDNSESLLLGEKIAIGILEEQKLMFGENFTMTVPLFNGESLTI